jgi:hypothetical protein
LFFKRPASPSRPLCRTWCRTWRSAWLLSVVTSLAISLYGCAAVHANPAPVTSTGANASTRAWDMPGDAYVESLVARARAQGLAETRAWLRLGHYRLGMLGTGFLGGGYTSEADSEAFFLAPQGKSDPQAELSATLRAFFAPASATTGPLGEGERGTDGHPLCRFPGRFLYLREALGIDAARLPVQSCPGFETFYSELDPGSITLLFSSYYLNNPASAFGHTFLRVNKAHTLTVGKRRELLDYGIDFSADVDTDNALIYGVKGLAGLFPGTFKRIPYFYKVRQYNDYESRDLWEYEIELSPAQLTLLVAHLWELGQAYFRYYYLSENCSYQILALLDVANPELDLMSRLHSPVLPSDTVKILFTEPGLVRSRRYRPSLRTQLKARVATLDGDERELVEELAYDPDVPFPSTLSSESRVHVLDAAADLIDIRYGEEIVMKTGTEGARKKQRVLERRAELLVPSADLFVHPPTQRAPEVGHGSARFGLGASVAKDRAAPTLDFRVNLHDLADPSDGYPEHFAIEFMHVRLQLWSDRRLEVDDLALFRVVSLTPQTHFDRQLSWKLDVGGDTLDDAGCDRCFAPHIKGGTGAAFSFIDDALLMYAMVDGLIAYSGALEGLEDTHLRLGVGPSGGVRMRFHPRFLTLLTGEIFWLPEQDPRTSYRVDLVTRVLVTRVLGFELSGRLARGGPSAQLITLLYL